MRVTGTGWSFPVNLGERERISLASDEENIRQSIYVILNTIPGERVMRPQFGCEIHELLFAPANEETAATAERYVTESLNRWEPRITVRGVYVTPMPGDIGALSIRIDYETNEQHDVRSLVYPFYLQPS